MGFSVVGASVIMMAAMLVAGNALANTMLEMERTKSKAEESYHERQEFVRHTYIELKDGSYQPFDLLALFLGGHLYLNVTNNGSTTLDVQKVNVIVSGEWRTDDFDWHRVDGQQTDVWTSGQTLNARVTLSGFLGLGPQGAPARALLFAETGQYVLWESL